MAFKFFSQRQHGEEVPDVLQYDDLPEDFRNQLFYIASDLCRALDIDLMQFLLKSYCRESGDDYLRSHSMIHSGFEARELLSSYIDDSSTDELLDLIDYMYNKLFRFSQRPTALIQTVKVINASFAELNDRFKQHNLGYEVTNGQLVRIDNKLIHAQYVKPALQLLGDEEFAGAEDEYRKAFEARRAGNNKDAILNAGKCFESVLKTICEKKKYPFNPQKDTANKLVDILKVQGFFPEYLESHLNGIITTLQSGAPTVRNKVAGHGQGSEITEAPDCLVDYVLGLVAVNSVLLVKLYKESK